MVSSSFHPFYTARTLEAISAGERFVPVYASSNSKIYPFQIAAANYALRSPYQKGAVLCDEAGLGKSHEAMLVITQKWLEGQQRILLVVPNADLLSQWTMLMDEFYSVLYVVLSTRPNGMSWRPRRNPIRFFRMPLLSQPTNLPPLTRNLQRLFLGT